MFFKIVKVSRSSFDNMFRLYVSLKEITQSLKYDSVRDFDDPTLVKTFRFYLLASSKQ